MVDVYLNDKSRQAFIDRLPTLIFLYTLSVVGFFGNSLVLVVFLARFPPSSTRTFIMAMSISDLIMNVLGLPLGSLKFLFLYNFNNPSLCRAINGIQRLSAGTSGWILAFVALDRRHRVCAPFKSQLTPFFAWLLVLTSFCLGGLVAFPFIPIFGERRVPTGVANISGCRCEVDDRFVKTGYETAESVTTILSFVAVILIISASYAQIGWRIRKTARRLVQKPHSDSADANAATRTNGAQSDDVINSDYDENVPTEQKDGGIRKSLTQDPVDFSPNAHFFQTQNTVVITTTPSIFTKQADAKKVPRNGSPDGAANTFDYAKETAKPIWKSSLDNLNVTSDGLLQSSAVSSSCATLSSSVGLDDLPAHSEVTSPSACAQSKTVLKTENRGLAKVKAHGRSRTTLIMFVLTVLLVVNFLPYIIVL